MHKLEITNTVLNPCQSLWKRKIVNAVVGVADCNCQFNKEFTPCQVNPHFCTTGSVIYKKHCIFYSVLISSTEQFLTWLKKCPDTGRYRTRSVWMLVKCSTNCSTRQKDSNVQQKALSFTFLCNIYVFASGSESRCDYSIKCNVANLKSNKVLAFSDFVA